MEKTDMVLELAKKFVKEAKNPTKWGYNPKLEKYTENALPNRAKLKRLRLMLHEIMYEIEKGDVKNGE